MSLKTSKSHSLISPSGASKWINCPPSAVFESKHAKNESSYADEGTLAHSLYELLIKNHLGEIKKPVFDHEYKIIKKHQYYTTDMESHCRDLMELVLDLAGSDFKIHVEKSVDLSKYIPEGKGTIDTILISSDKMIIIDLKYGKGVKVDALENKQQMIYALGAYEEFYGTDYDLEIELHIYQPRLNHHDSMAISTSDLIDWAYLVVIPAAKQAIKGEGLFTPGDHCRFCSAKNNCKAFYDNNLSIAKFDFLEANELTDDQISYVLDKGQLFKNWLNGIEEYALNESISNGKKWPGFKLIEGRSTRKYTDEEKIIEKLIANKIKKDLFLTEPKLVGITSLEKNLSKKTVDKLLSDYITKPLGAPTLVRETDKRSELNANDQAIKIFSNINN